MSTPALIMWAVVFAIGVPAAWSNPTAGALVLAKFAGWGIYKITGNNLPVEYYLFPDILVLACIYAKNEHACYRPYRSAWHQLKCVLLERSPADRFIVLVFPVMWALYGAALHPYYKWWALYYLVLAQFFAAGIEVLSNSLHGHAEAGKRPPQPPGFLLVAFTAGGRFE